MPVKKKGKRKKRQSKLTPRERKFAEALAEGHTVVEAGRIAGYSEATLSSQIYKNAEKSRIVQEIEDIRERNNKAFERAGLSLEARIQKIIELTDAKKTITNVRCNGRGLIELLGPDCPVQLKAVCKACQMCGDYPA